MVYCRIGLITRTKAGSTPAKRDDGPSLRRRLNKVPIVPGFLVTLFSPPGNSPSADSFFRAIILVLITQMGLVSKTVAEPAMAPAIMLSTVVSFLLARPAVMAAFSKNARVHSYQ